MNKFAVIKKCFAKEMVMVEADHKDDAINRVCEGEGYQVKLDLEWDGDLPPHFWDAEETMVAMRLVAAFELLCALSRRTWSSSSVATASGSSTLVNVFLADKFTLSV